MGSRVKFYNRYTKALENEPVYGEHFLRFLYGSKLGSLALNQLIKRKLFSEIYGRVMRRASSKKYIAPFIKRYKIDSSVFEKKVQDFTSFDDFFSRKLKKSARPIAVDQNKVIFPCDGRHIFIEDVNRLPAYFIKGQRFDLHSLLQNDGLAKQFRNCSIVISRLSPADYHRFHFPCNSVIQQIYKINGDYRSVSPIAVRPRIKILLENKRIVSVLQSDIAGKFLMVEVGATCVGSITQTAEAGRRYYKGEEKGFFSFGGSTVITIFRKGSVVLADDVRMNTENGVETFALMGDCMGLKI